MNPSTHDTDLQKVIKEQMTKWDVPGMTVAVWENNELREYAHGVASLDTNHSITADTLLQIGSISKVFTATLVMILAEEGKLDIDSPVINWLPTLNLSDKTAQNTLTMRHLLSHGTGLYGDWFEDFGIGDDALSKAMQEIHKLEQITSPGTAWSYCNSGFYIAGAVIESVTGMTFEKALHEKVFKPLGMEHSFFFAHEAIVYPVAVGHVAKPGEDHTVARRYPLPRNVNAAGGIISTVGDLIKFARFHMGDGTVDGVKVLSKQSLDEMKTPQIKAAGLADHYAIAWAVREWDGGTLISHGGSTNGFQAYLTTVPEQNFALAQLTNSGRGRAAYEKVESWAVEHYCDLSKPDPDRISLSDDYLNSLTGNYKQPLAEISISRAEDGLLVDIIDVGGLKGTNERTKQPTMHIRPFTEVDFIIEGGEFDGTHVDFVLNDDGSPRFFRYHGRLSWPVAQA